MNKLNYLGVMICTDSGMVEEVSHMVLEGRKVWGVMAKLWKENMISREVKRELYESVVIPTMVSIIRERCGCGCKLSVLGRIDRNVLKIVRACRKNGG